MAKKVGGGGAIMQPYTNDGEYSFNEETVERNTNFTPKNGNKQKIKEDIPTNKNKVKTPEFVKTKQEAVDYLTNKLGMIVDDSVNSGIEDELFVAITNKLIELDLNFNAISNFDKVTMSAEPTEAFAYVSSHGGCEVDNLNLSPRFYKTKKECVDRIIEDRNRGATVDFNDDFAEYAVITHEYGHIIQNSLLKKQGFDKRVREIIQEVSSNYGVYRTDKMKSQIRKEKKAIATQMKKDILKIASRISKEEGLDMKMSSYGGNASKPGEFFAEAFLNSQGGKPNAIGKAILEYLKGVK